MTLDKILIPTQPKPAHTTSQEITDNPQRLKNLKDHKAAILITYIFISAHKKVENNLKKC